MMSRLLAFRTGVVAFAYLTFALSAAAQSREVRGVVRDSATGNAVSGVVVMTLDAVGTTLSRTISGDRGQYRLQANTNALLLRAIRIGYRATTERLPLVAAPLLTVDLTVATLPHQLDAMQVTATAARGCPIRPDHDRAFALLDQARAGLLATIVARERSPAELLVLRYERFLDLDGAEVVRQIVSLDSSKSATTSFNAVHSAVDFVDRGFRTGANGENTYYGPDAEVLLDERFQRGYCFSVAAADSGRVSQLGLHFSAANRRSGRIDIDGTVWIDTAARVLRDISFRYVGVEALAEAFGAGGHVSFRTLPNGVSFIDQWKLRLVGATESSGPEGSRSSQLYNVREVGGELARARWPDGEVWLGPQSTMHLTAVTPQGAPVIKGTVLNLAGTDYRASTDSAGRATFNSVLPGPYTVDVADLTLAPIDVQIPTGRALSVRRGSSTLARVTVPTALEYVSVLCGRPPPTSAEAWVVARVVSGDGTPAAGVKWRASWAEGTRWRIVSDNGITGIEGLVLMCDGFRRNSSIELAVWRDPKDAVRMQRIVENALTVTRIQLPTLATATVATKRPASTGPTVVASGLVRDSASGRALADARVTFMGTPFEGATDSTGTFVVGGLASGAYTVEVSTPWFDSIGVVARTEVSLSVQSTRLSLFGPSFSSILMAACGTTDATTGFVTGRVRAPNASEVPGGMRVVAEWEETATDSGSRDGSAPAGKRLAWREASVSASGAFRVCGLPAGTRMVLRTESDSIAIWGAPPQEVSLPADRRFARVDLQLDSLTSQFATLVGTVVLDSAGLPGENAEITITDLKRSVLADRRGVFRMNDIPVGPHLITIKRLGSQPVALTLNFDANRVVEQRVQLSRVNTLATVAVEAEEAPAAFEERRARGVGRFLTRADLEKHRGRQLGVVITQVGGFGAASGGSHSWVLGKRAPSHLLPTAMPRYAPPPKSAPPGTQGRLVCRDGSAPPCKVTPDDLRDLGYYCPTHAERSQGIPVCACYSKVYIDGTLMNNSRPTEPFDANTVHVDDLIGVEFYATTASTPSRYSSMNAICGVMLMWTRRK